MDNDEEKNNVQTNRADFYCYLKVWKHYEDIAMHFNDLIIRLRTQSIGGLAALATILGIYLHSQDGSQSFKCGLAVIAILFLILLWIAIWILDMCYYNRLLEGAVNAILELEKDREGYLRKKEINLSTNIENAFTKRFPHEPKGCMKRCLNSRNRFYLIVLCALAFIFFVSICKYCEGYNEKRTCSSSQSTVQNIYKNSNILDVNKK
jgi:hypothetical protein